MIAIVFFPDKKDSMVILIIDMFLQFGTCSVGNS